MSKVYCLNQLTPSEEQALRARYFSVEPMMCVCQYFGLMLKSDGHVQMLGQPNDQAAYWKPFRAEDWTGVIKLYKSERHIVGLKCDGTVVACGTPEDVAKVKGSFTGIYVDKAIKKTKEAMQKSEQ